jgi:hypothetical protein
MTLDDARNLAIITGTVVAALTLIKAVVEYTRQNAQKRAEYYTKLREKFKENNRFTELFELLRNEDNDDPKLAELAYQVKQDFLGFYEDIALLMNSGLLKKPVAHYMFAYYAIRCWESKHFWEKMDRASLYWSLFRHFVKEMSAVEKKLTSTPLSIRGYKL